MNINFNLLRKKNGTHILMSITFNGIRIQTTINEKIDEKNWNKKKQRLKGNSTDAFNINSYLMKIENNARDIYYKFKIEGIIPTKNQFKEKLSQKLNGVNTSLSFYDFVDEFIKNSKNSKKKY